LEGAWDGKWIWMRMGNRMWSGHGDGISGAWDGDEKGCGMGMGRILE
jgi:hypothetical protein